MVRPSDYADLQMMIFLILWARDDIAENIGAAFGRDYARFHADEVMIFYWLYTVDFFKKLKS